MIDFCTFQSELFRTSNAHSEKKFNHDFNRENRHSETGYIEIAVLVPSRIEKVTAAEHKFTRLASSLAG